MTTHGRGMALFAALFLTVAAVAGACQSGNPNDLLSQIKTRGKILVNTDPNYAPQSFLRPDGTFEGFDIDVANEIGKRLGVTVQFETNSFDLVVAGGWNGRWDVSVGSVTITDPRKTVLDFTKPYYYTPAQMAASLLRVSPPLPDLRARESVSAPRRPTSSGSKARWHSAMRRRRPRRQQEPMLCRSIQTSSAPRRSCPAGLISRVG